MKKYLLALMLLTTNAFAGPIFHDTDGKVLTAYSFEHKWVVLNYWASWCDNCKEEIPELNAFYQHNHNTNTVFYGVNYDDVPAAQLNYLMSTNHIAYPNLIDDPRAYWKLGAIEVIPVTFFINPQGQVVKKLYGTSNEKILKETLDSLQHAAS